MIIAIIAGIFGFGGVAVDKGDLAPLQKLVLECFQQQIAEISSSQK